MPKVSFNLIEKFVSDSSLDEINSNRNKINKLKIIIRDVIETELTKRQKQILILYFYKNLKMTEISKMLNINKSTVSRTIERGIKKIHKFLKYYKLR